jgi:hypothetical protein
MCVLNRANSQDASISPISLPNILTIAPACYIKCTTVLLTETCDKMFLECLHVLFNQAGVISLLHSINNISVNRVLLMQYYNYLQFAAIRDIQKQRARESHRRVYGRARECISIHDYYYIEKLLNNPLNNFRKYLQS